MNKIGKTLANLLVAAKDHTDALVRANIVSLDELKSYLRIETAEQRPQSTLPIKEYPPVRSPRLRGWIIQRSSET
jgi:hypothetical protein